MIASGFLFLRKLAIRSFMNAVLEILKAVCSAKFISEFSVNVFNV